MYIKMAFPGYLYVRIKGKDCQKVLSMCTYHNVPLWDVTSDLDSFSFKLPWNQYQTIMPLCEKTNSEIIILSRHGLLLCLSYLKQHISFLAGIVLCLALIIFFNMCIWDIQVTGNIYYDSPVLIAYLKTQGVTPGSNKGSISCIELADKIRQEFPKIKWTSVELVGSNLIVHVKENLAAVEKTEEALTEPADIVSDKEGIVKSIYVRAGIANVVEGDTCQKGDILVKGQIPIYNDNLEIVRYEFVDADADIILQYDYHYYSEIEREVSEKILLNTSKVRVIQLFDYQLSLSPLKFAKFNQGKSKKDDYTTEELRNISQFKLTPSFELPCYFGTNTVYEYKILTKYLSESETKQQLEEEFAYFCDDLEKKGVQIYKNNVKMYISDAKGTALGKVTVFEKIGEKKSFSPKEFEIEIDEESQSGTIQEE